MLEINILEAESIFSEVGEYVTLKGDKGDKGDTGAQGPQGETGHQGPKGEAGPRGPKGDKGDKGDTGPQGPQGETGQQGPSGPAGTDGKTPEYGVDYGTTEQIAEIAQSAAEILKPDVNQIKDDLSAEQTAREQADTSLQQEISDKLSEPAEGLAVGKYFRVAQIDENGHAVLKAVDLPIASGNQFGLVRVQPAGTERGVYISSEGFLAAQLASASQIDKRTNFNNSITPYNLDYAVKAAMCDGKGAAWTADEQAAARERMGINEEFQRVFFLHEIWEEGTSLIVDVNNLSHLRIFIELGSGIISSADDYSLISFTDSNGNRTRDLFELGNLPESNRKYNQVAYCKYDINDVPTMARWGGSGGNPSFAVRGGLVSIIAEGDIIPNFLVSKIHFSKLKGDVKIAIWGC